MFPPPPAKFGASSLSCFSRFSKMLVQVTHVFWGFSRFLMFFTFSKILVPVFPKCWFHVLISKDVKTTKCWFQCFFKFSCFSHFSKMFISSVDFERCKIHNVLVSRVYTSKCCVHKIFHIFKVFQVFQNVGFKFFMVFQNVDFKCCFRKM